jgi:hypothetical protein
MKTTNLTLGEACDAVTEEIYAEGDDFMVSLDENAVCIHQHNGDERPRWFTPDFVPRTVRFSLFYCHGGRPVG